MKRAEETKEFGFGHETNHVGSTTLWLFRNFESAINNRRMQRSVAYEFGGRTIPTDTAAAAATKTRRSPVLPLVGNNLQWQWKQGCHSGLVVLVEQID